MAFIIDMDAINPKEYESFLNVTIDVITTSENLGRNTEIVTLKLIHDADVAITG